MDRLRKRIERTPNSPSSGPREHPENGIVRLSESRAHHGRDTRRAYTGEGSQRLDSAEVAKIIADIAVDKKASDVVILDIRSQSVIADYFVICTGSNSRQIQAIAGAIEDRLSELELPTRGFEGAADNGWMLLDCGDVIVHIFGPLEREFYRLERLWSAAPSVVYLQ